MYMRIASLAIFFVLACTGAASAAACSHAESIAILGALGPENSIGKALDILKKRKADFMILYKAGASGPERATTAEKLPSLKYHSLEVWVSSDFPGGFIITYNERLALAFNSHGVLTGSSCEKIGTGP